MDHMKLTGEDLLSIIKPNYQVTKNFNYSDFICPCCDTLKLVPAFYNHVTLLEILWNRVGFPFVVISGYRCKLRNADVGGAPRSWHLLFATDVRPADKDYSKIDILWEAAEGLFTGIGIYEEHIHVDLRPETLIWRG